MSNWFIVCKKFFIYENSTHLRSHFTNRNIKFLNEIWNRISYRNIDETILGNLLTPRFEKIRYFSIEKHLKKTRHPRNSSFLPFRLPRTGRLGPRVGAERKPDCRTVDFSNWIVNIIIGREQLRRYDRTDSICCRGSDEASFFATRRLIK